MRPTLLVRTVLILFFLFASFGPSQLRAQQFEPYYARTNSGGADVHAGPARNIYVTEKLDAGTTVEVYEQTGGWCAIKPTANSFSLVLADNIELLNNQTARVTSDTAKSWVGTHVGIAEKPLWQIRLKQGEHLKLSLIHI